MRNSPRIFQGPFRSIKLLQIFCIVAIILFGVRWLSPQQPRWRQEIPGLKLAYATLLLPENTTKSSEVDHDPYFLSVRLLNYQLQHDKTTRTAFSIPFLVLVTSDVPTWKCDQLSREGAVIVPVDKLTVDWIEPGDERWRDVMIKLRLFELTHYDRILFLDADTFLFKPLDGIFDDPAAHPRETLQQTRVKLDEGYLPATYLFATMAEVMHTTHSYPPVPMSYFNAGFFLLSPSLELFRYYISLFKLPGRFDTTYPEQNLLNYAHRQDGNMPWGRLFYGWNIKLPHPNDIKKGVASVHAKLWTSGSELQPIEQMSQNRWQVKRREMEKFYQS